ncbi:MAG: tyrosine-protein kinase family protein [Candidatus Hermodarchaeota archaeon]
MEKILIHSYKGGTGKTTVALNTASLLARDNRILLIENDFLMPSLFYILMNEPDIYFNDYFKGDATFKETIVRDVRPNLDVIFTNKDFDPNEKIVSSDQNWFLSQLKTMIQDLDSLKDQYKFVIFDSPPGWHLIVINLIMLANRAILLLRPNSFAIDGTKRMIEIIYKRAKPMNSWEIYLLFNQVPEIDMRADIERWTGELKQKGLKYAGSISCSCDTSYQMAHEAMILPEDHRFNIALQAALDKILM